MMGVEEEWSDQEKFWGVFSNTPDSSDAPDSVGPSPRLSSREEKSFDEDKESKPSIKIVIQKSRLTQVITKIYI